MVFDNTRVSKSIHDRRTALFRETPISIAERYVLGLAWARVTGVEMRFRAGDGLYRGERAIAKADVETMKAPSASYDAGGRALSWLT